MKNIFNTIKKAVLPLLGLTLLTSCGDEHDFTPYSTGVPENAANVKFIHGAVGANGTNFQVNYFNLYAKFHHVTLYLYSTQIDS